MGRLLMTAGIRRGPVHLDQHETGWVVVLLTDVKPRDARLLYTLASIGQRRLAKGFDRFWFDVDMYVDDKHCQNS